jgi:hypothetical protein
MQRILTTRNFSRNLPKNLKLWHSPNARSLRCVWTLEEMSITNYELITMPFPPRIFYKDFLKTNLLGTIPYLEDGDVKMTESCGSKSANPLFFLYFFSTPCHPMM